MREKTEAVSRRKIRLFITASVFLMSFLIAVFFLLPIQEYYLKNDCREQALNAGN